MSADLSHASFSLSLTTLAATYVTTCWRDQCTNRVDPEDDLGLCPRCREELRRAT